MNKSSSDEQQPSFTPHTNAIQRNMTAVQSYLEEPAFARLARVRTIASLAASGSSATGLDTSTSQSVSARGRSGTPSVASRRPASAPRGRSPDSSSVERRSLAEFLARQNQTALRKQQKMNAIRAEIDAPHAPQLCKKSVELAKQAGSFEDRQKRHEVVKEQNLKQVCCCAVFFFKTFVSYLWMCVRVALEA